MTVMDTNLTDAKAAQTPSRKRLFAFSVPAIVLVYFTTSSFLDIAGLSQRANWDNAVTLASDSWSHKVHVTRSNRDGSIDYAVEERKGRYPEGQRPEWVSVDGEIITIDLGGDHIVRYLPDNRTEIEIGFPPHRGAAEGVCRHQPAEELPNGSAPQPARGHHRAEVASPSPARAPRSSTTSRGGSSSGRWTAPTTG